MLYNDKSIVFLDGKFIKAKDAKISLYSQTLHYGNGVVEGIRAYETEHGTQIFKGIEHFERLRYSAQRMMIDSFAYTNEELEHIAYRLLEENKLKNAYIRPMIFLGDAAGLVSVQQSHLFIGVFKWAKYHGTKPLDVMVSSYRRPHPDSYPVDAKINGVYVNSVLAATEAKNKGFGEAILLDHQGFLAQAPGANLFVEKDGVLYTPPKGSILPGITRQTIMDLVKQKEETEVVEKWLKPEDLQNADAAFLTGTAAEIAMIKSVDGVPLKPKSKNSISFRISEAYSDTLRTAFAPNYTII